MEGQAAFLEFPPSDTSYLNNSVNESNFLLGMVNPECKIQLRGRVISFRRQGGIAFGQIADQVGIGQFAIRKSHTKNFKEICADIKIGSIVVLYGCLGLSSTKMPTLFCYDVEICRSPTKGFPDKWNGISEDTKRRHRFLECAVEPDSRNFVFERARLLRSLRCYLDKIGFTEVETPVLASQASGAMARPFRTSSFAHGREMFLRIAPETYLKRMVAGGFEKVYEIGKNFRNEGEDSSHLPEFSFIEWYVAFVDYRQNLELFDSFLREYISLLPKNLREELYSKYKIGSIEVKQYRNYFYEYGYCEGAIDEMDAVEMDMIFKKEIRPNIIDPVYVIDYPAKLSPMAKRKNSDPDIVEQWQLVIDGHEIVKCYTELTDPVQQRQLLLEQAKQKANGNPEAMELEEDFLSTMEWGMPPMSGLGMGIDRLLCIVLGKEHLKDVVFFPPVF